MTIRTSAIIPVTRMNGRLAHIERMLKNPYSKSLEFIISHDVADDFTSSELHDLKNLNPNIKLIEKRFGSPGLARNAGLEIAKGEWIVFWDSDDDPLIEEFIKMIDITDRMGLVAGIGDYQAINELDNSIFESSPNGELSKLYTNVGLWRMCFRRDRIKDLRFTEFRMAEDQIFFAQLELKVSEVHFHKKSVYTYFFGSSGHLTQDYSAVLDLRGASALLMSFLSKDPSNRNLLKMFLKQKMTLVRRIRAENRFREIYITFRELLIIKCSPSDLFYSINSALRKTLK